LGKECFRKELSELPGGEKAYSLRMVLPKEQKEPLSQEKVGFLGNVGLPRGRKEPLNGEIVGSPRRVVFLKELMEPPSRDKVNEWV
jgi:hypothetical protein